MSTELLKDKRDLCRGCPAELFFQQLMQQLFVEHQIGAHLFETRVLVFELPQAFIDKFYKILSDYPLLIDYLKKETADREKPLLEDDPARDVLWSRTAYPGSNYDYFVKTREYIKLLVEIDVEYRETLEDRHRLELLEKVAKENLLEMYNQSEMKDPNGLKQIEERYSLKSSTNIQS